MKNTMIMRLLFTIIFSMFFSSLVHAQVRILVIPSVDSKKWTDCSFPLVRLLNSQDTSLQFETFKEGITNPKLYDATVKFDISLKEINPAVKTPVSYVGSIVYYSFNASDLNSSKYIFSKNSEIRFPDEFNLKPEQIMNDKLGLDFSKFISEIRSYYGLLNINPLGIARVGLIDKKSNQYVKESYYFFPNDEPSLNDEKYKVKHDDIELALWCDKKIYVGKYVGEIAHIKINEMKGEKHKKNSFDWPQGKGVFTAIGLKIDGEWKDGMVDGKASIVKNVLFKDDVEYEYTGELKKNERSGNGKLKINGMIYDGLWSQDEINGKGRLEYNSSQFYGDFISNQRQGKGVLTIRAASPESDEIVVSGNWKNDHLNGPGIIFYTKYTKEDDILDTLSGEIEGYSFLFTGKGTKHYSNSIYTGNFVKSQFEGEGICKMSNGDIYNGLWKNGVFQSGKVSLTYSDKSSYIGEMSERKKNGKGKFVNPGGIVYDGDWSNDQFTGKGKIVYEKGTYEGDIVLDLPEGQGTFKYSYPSQMEGQMNDSIYTGGYLKGLPEGRGKLEVHYFSEESDYRGRTYNGDWVNGKKEGAGKEELNLMIDKYIYEGEWKNNEKNGKGTLTGMLEYGSDQTVGTWVNGKLSGYGECTGTYQDPETSEDYKFSYKGNFENDSYEGQGTLVNSDGTYVGSFQSNMKNGEGKMTFKSGNVYIGQWKDNEMNGEGKLILANKTIQQGIFVNGEFQAPFICPTAKIGNQVWMSKNLNVDRFRNGDVIQEAKTATEWKEAIEKKIPAWSYYNNDPTTASKYGKLYNLFAIMSKRGLAPEGWHIPSSDECVTLLTEAEPAINQLKLKISELKEQGINTSELERKLRDLKGDDGNANAAYNLRNTTGWKKKNGCNKFGFSATPNPYRNHDGNFETDNFLTFNCWTTSNAYNSWFLLEIHQEEFRTIYGELIVPSSTVDGTDGYSVKSGYPVRCIKD